MEYWKKKAHELKVQTLALYYAAGDRRVPWYGRGWVLLVAAYAFSPVDLIPDFVPVLGYLDDLVLIPVGVWIALKLIPAEVMAECREKAARELGSGKPQFRWMGVVIVAAWLLALGWVAWTIWNAIQ